MTTTSTLSRRSIMTAVATIGAAAAVPAIAGAAEPNKLEQAIAVLEAERDDLRQQARELEEQADAIEGNPTPIAKLWEKRQTVKKKYELAHQRYEELERAVLQRVAKPDPMIQYSKENDALGLEWPGAAKRPIGRVLGTYIEPVFIEREIRKLGPGYNQVYNQMHVLDPDEYPLTKMQREERKGQLKKMLKVARSHEKKVKEAGRTMGRDAANDRMDALCNQNDKLEFRIFRMPSLTSGDHAIKLAIYDEYAADDPHIWVEEIVADLRQYFQKTSLAA